MFKNVLVGVDGRPNGRDAIALASHLVDPDGKLTLVHVHSGDLRPSHAISPGLVRGARSLAHAARAGARRRGGVGGARQRRGDEPWARASRAGGGAGRDLLVVGSCSHGAFGRAMLGDDTRAALNGAPCAVAIAPLGYAEHPTPIAKVGVAYNVSPESEAALAMAHSLAAANRASVHALEVVMIPTVAYGGMMAPAIGEGLDMMLQEADSRMKELPDVEGRAVYGLAGEELAAFGDQVDLLVVGSRGYGPVKRLVLGSTSEYLQRHARCSLLVLPRAATSEGSSEHPATEEGAYARS